MGQKYQEFSLTRVTDGIPTFVREALDLHEDDQVFWDMRGERNDMYVVMFKREYNTFGHAPPTLDNRQLFNGPFRIG